MFSPWKAIHRNARSSTAASAVLLAGLLASCASQPPDAGETVDAVVLIVVDTMRPDRLSCYGYAGHRTPAIDALAGRGALFRNAYSVASWTVPSVGAIFTSRYPSQLGLVEAPAEPGRTLHWREMRGQVGKTIPRRADTLAELLSEMGFRTAAFVNQPTLLVGDGFVQGFDEWFYPATPEEIRRWDPGQPVEWEIWQPDRQVASIIDGGLVYELIRWLDGQEDGRTFVYLHLLTPHAPYQPLPGFLEEVPGRPPSLSELYDAEIRIVDRLIGQVAEAVARRWGSRAAVLLTSDHGESLGEHGMTEHGHSLHSEVVRVPLILAAPGVPAGASVETAVRTIDILPTLLDLVAGSGSSPETAEGSSLLPLVRGRDPDRPVFSEAMLYGSTERSLQAGRFKLMWDEQGDRTSLFDVAADPGEENDLAAQETPRVERMTRDLREWNDRVGREVPAGAASDEDQALQALRALGYVD